jgi:hypothetical protein
MIKNPYVKNILSALAVAGFGFVLLNLAFILDFLFQSLIIAIIKLFVHIEPAMDLVWFPPVMHVAFVILISVISWFVFRSKLRVLYKAIFMTVPAAVVLVTIGMFLYRWPLVSYPLGVLSTIATLYYFYRSKQPWLYFYAVILVALALLAMNLTGQEI